MVMFLGWVGNLLLGRYLTPVLVKSKLFSRMEIFSNDNKNTTIINKTEKVIVREDNSMSEIASSAVYAVVNILSFEKREDAKKINLSSVDELEKYSKGMSGAGTILTNDGIIVTYRTNIIEENAEYKVVSLGGNVLDATLVGIDEFTNLAYLKVAGFNLTTIPFAGSSINNSGKKVIVIGNLSGLQRVHITDGIITSFDEKFNLSGGEISSSEKLEGVLNVDFTKDDNYVGGPIINYSGELMAINAKLEIDGEKKYFQIPVEVIKESMQKIVENKIKQSAKLGIYYISVDPFYKSLKNLSSDKGALIYSSTGKQGLAILAGSPAEKHGLKIGDLILSIDGNEINSLHPLSNFINQYEEGNSATLGILRDGKNMEIVVEF
ncbi:MAG: Protease Do [Candidatus Moranbacteria bacterium GW2011_GWF2_34_56]|nr:MAG: Protease Do [Candidatus Moranbacteria bacterium GW2011_GWF1_34_10]KKP64253.1 MAG: Protease Do [Candidatus Moranbacteria bacterium GW2011_GWF2_34_56]